MCTDMSGPDVQQAITHARTELRSGLGTPARSLIILALGLGMMMFVAILAFVGFGGRPPTGTPITWLIVAIAVIGGIVAAAVAARR